MYRVQCGPWCSLFGLVPCWHSLNSFTNRICEGKQHFAKLPQKKMLYEDIIYGRFELPPYVVSIIEKPLFQRLKAVHQLGVMKYIYPEARGTRYEHCIGTYKRASEMLDSLEQTLPGKEKKLPRDYRMAVEIAALLHDIGHGPFSHTWERCNKKFIHEENGIDCIDELIPEEPVFKPLHDSKKYGIELIKALILGDKERLSKPLPNNWHFIFDIVNNKRCGLDVDKWDYLKRDAYYLESLCKPDIDFDDVFLRARVAPKGDCIEYRVEDYDKIYRIFCARWQLFIEAYCLPKVLALEQILSDALSKTPALGRINAKSDLSGFCDLTDDRVLSIIKDDPSYKYFKQPDDIKPIDEANDTEQISPNVVITVEKPIQGPGKMMPSDESLPFYGDKCDKPAIERNNKETAIFKRFQLT